MRAWQVFTAVMVMTGSLAGCVADQESAGLKKIAGADPGRFGHTAAPYLDYKPQAPDMTLELIETDYLFEAADVLIHGRLVRPDGPGPFPVIVQFTPYTAPGRNAQLSNMIEPAAPTNPIGIPGDSFVNQFVRRGYAFVYGDVRGTGDSSGCLDLRGEKDILDAGKLTDFFGTQPWSNGKVGFIGASYPGSEAHMAGIANSPYLGAIVPVVASTSFYHYHHNDGVPYNGNHALGGTNAGYTQNAVSPTLNPQSENYLPRYLEEVMCPYKENIVDHGGLDQTGAYYAWWQERNLRSRAKEVDVPVLMAQGLADWNVKPDHIAQYFNDLDAPKTIIAGQWPHQYPKDAPEAYGVWWEYVASFFDTHLKGIETGMFTTDTAWIQDSGGAWHRSANFPLLPQERDEMVLHFTKEKTLSSIQPLEASQLAWYGCPNDKMNRGTQLAAAEDVTVACKDRSDQELVFLTEPFAVDTIISGVPLVKLTLTTEAPTTHLVAVMNKIGTDGSVALARENYGYLNPIYRDGIDKPAPLPDGAYTVTIDLYPQEDLIKAGERLEVRIRSDDTGRTIEFFDEGLNTLNLGPDAVNQLWLPIRPAEMQGVRLG